MINFPSFANFKKYPTTALLVLTCLCVGYLFNNLTNSTQKRIDYLEAQGKIKDARIMYGDSLIYNLQNQLLISNGVLRQVPNIIDSLTREKTENQVKTILKNK